MEQDKIVRLVYLFVGIGAITLALFRIQNGDYAGSPFAFIIAGFCGYRLLSTETNSKSHS